MKMLRWFSCWLRCEGDFPVSQVEWHAERIGLRPGRHAAQMRLARRYHGWH